MKYNKIETLSEQIKVLCETLTRFFYSSLHERAESSIETTITTTVTTTKILRILSKIIKDHFISLLPHKYGRKMILEKLGGGGELKPKTLDLKFKNMFKNRF